MFSQPEKNVEQFHIDPGMKVADLGSGAGHYSMALADAVGETGEVFAVEVVKDLLEKLKREVMDAGFSNVKTLWGDIEENGGTGLGNNIVERALISNTLFQVEDKEGVLKEAHRILKNNGKLLIVDWTDSFAGLGPQPEDIVTPQNARTLAEQAGFVYEKDIEAGDHHYGMIFIVRK